MSRALSGAEDTFEVRDDPLPLALEAAILSQMRSAVTPRSNCAKLSSMLSVSRPMLVVVLND